MNDQIEILLVLVVHVGLFAQEMGEGQDAGQGIVDFVGHPRGQTADRGQLFRSAHLLLNGLLELQFALGQHIGHVVDGTTQDAHVAGRPNPHPQKSPAITFRDMAVIRPIGRIKIIVTRKTTARLAVVAAITKSRKRRTTPVHA